MPRNVRAQTLKVGDILAATLENEVFSIKEIQVRDNLAFNRKEIVVKGPLGIMLKFHPDKHVRILNG